MKFDRRIFIQRSLLLLGVGAAASALGCSGGSSYGSSPSTPAASGGNCDANGTVLSTTGVTESHTHTIQLSAAEILAADPNAIFTTAGAGHTHPVQLTAQQYASLQANVGVTMNTGGGGDGHIHSVTFNCA